MKNQQRAKKKPRLTLREQYRQLAIRILKKERTKILDIQTLQELIELEIGRSMKKDELIAAFSRKDCGLEVVPQEKITWVIFHKPAKTTPEEKAPKLAKAPAKKREKKTVKPKQVATEEKTPEPTNTPAKRVRKPANPNKTSTKKLTPAEFTLQAIRDLRKPPHMGIHMVYSGFNAGFRKYFPDLDPVQATDELSGKGIVVKKLTRGGALLYIPGETPKAKVKKRKKAKKTKTDKGDEVLKKMGLA